MSSNSEVKSQVNTKHITKCGAAIKKRSCKVLDVVLLLPYYLSAKQAPHYVAIYKGLSPHRRLYDLTQHLCGSFFVKIV